MYVFTQIVLKMVDPVTTKRPTKGPSFLNRMEVKKTLYKRCSACVPRTLIWNAMTIDRRNAESSSKNKDLALLGLRRYIFQPILFLFGT